MKKWMIIGILIVAGVVLIPVVFAFCFQGSGSSSFLNLMDSTISVENWFSFWITGLAGMASVVVAVVALYTSNRIEDMHIADSRNSERLLFIPTEAKQQGSWDVAFELAIYFPRGILLLEKVTVDKVICTYCGKDLSVKTAASLNASFPHFLLQFNNDGETSKVISDWKDFSQVADAHELRFKVCFNYIGLDYREKDVVCNVDTVFWLVYTNPGVEVTVASANHEKQHSSKGHLLG